MPPDVAGAVRAPQDAIWNGMPIARIHVGCELDSGHAVIRLNHCPGQPFVNPVAVMDVVAEYFNGFSYTVLNVRHCSYLDFPI
jgi:hypothetical protein